MGHVFRYRHEMAFAAGAEITLDDDASHHLARVIRRSAGSEVEIVDSAGRIWPAEVVEPGPPARVRVADAPRIAPIRPPIRLFVGAAEAARLDLVAEKATELGAREIAVFRSERADRAPGAASWDKRRRRLERVARAAALQAGWGAPPAISGVLAFEDVLATPAPGHGHLLDPEADTALDAALDRPPDGGREICLVIGPPAGFSRDEVARAAAAGLEIVRLGEGVLRTETAAISALALAVGARDRSVRRS